MAEGSVRQAIRNAANWRRAFFIAGIIVIALLLLWFAAHIPRTMAIFVIAALIAFGIQPLVRRLERKKIPRIWAIVIVYAALILLIVIGLVIVVPLTILQIQILAANAPSYAGSVHGWINDAQLWIQSRFPTVTLPENAFDLGKLSSDRVSVLASTTLASVGAILISTATAFFVGFAALILSFLFLLYDKQIGESFVGMFPESKRMTAGRLGVEITQLFGNYISGQVIVSAITGIVVAIFSAIVGFKFALILGIVTAVAYAIPIFGMIFAQIIALLLCAPEGWFVIIAVQVIMFLMARISDSILSPKIMADAVGVSPIGIMFAVFAGGELFGVPGLILGIPAAALIKILWRYFVAPWFHAQLDDA